MRLTASRPFLPWPIREISGKALRRKASSSRAGFSSSTMMVLMGMWVKEKYTVAGGQRPVKRGEMRPVASDRRPAEEVGSKRGLNAEVGAQRTLRREEWLRYHSIGCT